MENNNTLESEFPEKQNKRPVLLSVLLIISFIRAGFFLLSYFLLFGFKDMIYAGASGNPEQMGQAILMLETPGFLPAAILCELLILVGAIFMWRRKMLGFFIYLPGRIAALPLGYLFGVVVLDIDVMFILAALLTIAWPLAYFLLLKKNK